MAAVRPADRWSTRPDSVDLSPNKIAVFPLAERGVGVANSGEGVGVTYLIEAALEHADPMRLIDVTSRLTERQLTDPELITAAEAREIARAQGAAFYLQGVVLGHRDSTTVVFTGTTYH